MKEQNAERMLVSLLKEVCAARRIRLTSFSDDWVFCLQREGRTAYVVGFDFGVNNATAKMIAKDKSATSDLLRFHDVPRVEHRLFHSPELAGYVPLEGSWRPMLDYFMASGRHLVCKPNEGTGGRLVLRARTPLELEAAVHRILRGSRSVCLSPFELIGDEYRVAVLNGVVQFAYRKQRPALIGDGVSSVRRLLLARLDDQSDFSGAAQRLAELGEMRLDFELVPRLGERVELNWRHNLGQGAEPELLNEESPELREVAALALRGAAALGIDLASVDVVDAGGTLKILEINSGIMMESLVRSLPDGRALARRFYDRIVCAALFLDAAS
ncbi:MAG: RimK-like protein [Pseudomonadota bacterium]|nr:RimK-like protein [Pseudomonadota bacterium]